MEIAVELDRGVTVITPSGDLVASTADHLKAKASTPGTGGCRYMVLDLSQVHIMDSSGLNACLALHRELVARSGMLVFAKPSAAVEKVFRATRVDRRLHVVAQRQDGVSLLLEKMREAT